VVEDGDEDERMSPHPVQICAFVHPLLLVVGC